MKLIHLKILALLGSLQLVCLGTIFGQTPPSSAVGRPADDSLQVAVQSASGKERHPRHHAGFVDRVGLRPGQTVALKLIFKGRPAGESVTVSPLDGGATIGENARSTSAGGNVQLSYQAGANPGRYRVLVQNAGQEYELEFYVLDTDNPENNPPYVRVVD